MGWIIAGAVVAVILILLMTSVKVRFDYSDPGELRLIISWLFVTLVRIPAKTKKQKRRDKKAEKDVKSSAKAAAMRSSSSCAAPSDRRCMKASPLSRINRRKRKNRRKRSGENPGSLPNLTNPRVRS